MSVKNSPHLIEIHHVTKVKCFLSDDGLDKHHLTQVQLAKPSHMPQSSIARIENGDNVNMKSLFKIAHAMHQPMTIKIPD